MAVVPSPSSGDKCAMSSDPPKMARKKTHHFLVVSICAKGGQCYLRTKSFLLAECDPFYFACTFSLFKNEL